MHNNFKTPVYVVPGNHDLRSMTNRTQFEKATTGKHSTFSIDINGYHLVFLGLSLKNELGTSRGGIEKTRSISDDDIKWLKDGLTKNNLPILIFTHFGIANDQMTNNYWFEKIPEDALLKNRKKIKDIIEKHDVLAVFSGHQHWTKKLQEKNINYYIVGSLVEDINNNGIPDGVYLEVNINNHKVNIKEKHLEL